MSINVRYFGGAAEAAGSDRSTVALDPGATVADLRSAMSSNAALAAILPACSLLLDGVLARNDGERVPPGVCVDVLPPFAGG